jgi:hypothetical protein
MLLKRMNNGDAEHISWHSHPSSIHLSSSQLYWVGRQSTQPVSVPFLTSVNRTGVSFLYVCMHACVSLGVYVCILTQNNCELGKRHSKRGRTMERARGEARRPTVCLSMYSITENIYYSQLSVAILLHPEPNCFTSYSTRKGLGSLSLCAIALRSSPPSHVSTCNGQLISQLFCVHYMYVYKLTYEYVHVFMYVMYFVLLGNLSCSYP